MLNWNRVLKYVKLQIGLPSGFIEKSEEDIRDYLQEFTLREYSNYYPDEELSAVFVNNPDYRHPTKTWHYYIKDEDDLEILDVIDVYFSSSSDIFFGHPVLGVMSFNETKWFSLAAFESNYTSEYSEWNFDYAFVPPNMIRIQQQTQPEDFVVRYERNHPTDLRKIPPAMDRDFLDLCLADIKIWIGGFRTHFNNTQTPYGELPLNGETLKQEGMDKKRELIEKFQDDHHPPFIVDVG